MDRRTIVELVANKRKGVTGGKVGCRGFEKPLSPATQLKEKGTPSFGASMPRLNKDLKGKSNSDTRLGKRVE